MTAYKRLIIKLSVMPYEVSEHLLSLLCFADKLWFPHFFICSNGAHTPALGGFMMPIINALSSQLQGYVSIYEECTNQYIIL